MKSPKSAVSPFAARTVPLTLTLFGPMQTLVEGRPLPPLRSRKALWLLALLILRHGKPVEREWLAGTLWPDVDQEQAFSNLRPVLSELRRALGEQGHRLQSPSRHTLFLDIADAQADVIAFDKAIADGSLLALKQAVNLYRGPLLEGATEEWVGQERVVREQDCLRALGTLAEAAITAEDYSTAADYCRRTIALDPWRDGTYRVLMEALSRSGDTNAALQVYREFVQLLRSDPKAVPDAQTTALYTRLRAEARRQTTAPPVVPKEASTAPVVTGYLPHALTDLVGREDERLEVSSRLRRSRLVTLTGPGGIGKTRLALAVAEEIAPEYPDGVWMVALEALADGRLVAMHVAEALGLREELGQTTLESLTAYLRTKHLLLVLDNCEHLLEASADVSGHFLRECSGLQILATSREALGITGETAWGVPSLAAPDPEHLPSGRATLLRVLMGYESVQLFVERAQAVQTSFALTETNALPLARICARLVGLPLAIELAAARVKVLTVEQIAARLDDNLGLLTGGNRGAQSRQQTIRATLDWSYSLLSAAERVFLGRLSVFAGGWTLEAAEQICAGEGTGPEGTGEAWEALDLLTSLVDKSLVVFEPQKTEDGRYRLLEMVRQYAAERLNEAAGTKFIKIPFCHYFSKLAQEAEPHLITADQHAWLTRLEAEHDNLRAALAWYGEAHECAEAGLQLAAALWRFWERRGYYSEGWAYLTEALEKEDAQAHTYLRGKALNAAGVMAFYQGNYAAAKSLHEESLAISRETNNLYGTAWSLSDLGKVAFAQGEYAKAKSLYEESLAIFRELEDTRGIGWSLHQLGSMLREQGDYPAASALYEECLGISRRLGDQQGIAWALNDLGGIAAVQGNFEAAQSLYEESLAISRDLSDNQGIAWSLHHLGNVAYDRGGFEAAQSLHEESLMLFRNLGNKQAVGWSLHQLGNIAALLGDYAAAEPLQKENLAIQRDLKNKLGIGRALNSLARAALRQGNADSAQTLYAETIQIQKELKDRRGIAESLRGLAAVLALQAASEKAARLWGAAEAICEAIGAPIPPYEQQDYEDRLGRIRLVLNKGILDAAWAEGRTRTWEEAADYALESGELRA